jgi:tellurite resistance protein TerC
MIDVVATNGHSLWAWGGFIVFILLLLAFDLGVLSKGKDVIPVKEALWRSFGFFLLAMIFGAGVYQFEGAQKGTEFFTGYLIELSLSVDNIFVFVLIFTHFAVPAKYQHRVLFWGILGALVMRGVMIGAGAALIKEFAWVIYIFGGFLILSGIKMLIAADAEPDIENNRVINFMRSRFRVTETFEGEKFFVIRKGKRWMTPLSLVLILIEISDLVFAIDSIPAIFAITHDPFIVFTSNVFAILGLRSLYFALAGIVHRFHYLKYGLSLVLVLVGSKMVLNAWYDTKIIETSYALICTGFLIFGSVILSLMMTKAGRISKEQKVHLTTGWVPGSDEKKMKKSAKKPARKKQSK